MIKIVRLVAVMLVIILSLVACEVEEPKSDDIILPTIQVKQLEQGLSTVSFGGDYKFDEFLEEGGASSDNDVVTYLVSNVLNDAVNLTFEGNPFGCSTISTMSSQGDKLFGRNFDWNNTNAMIVESTPNRGYKSISTVNLDFIRINGLASFSSLPDEVQAIIAMYAPLDGMNEKGLAISVNMIQDSATIEQNSDKPDITTTTAIRLILDNAGTVAEAISLLESYDLHASMNYMVHFAITDAEGNSVAIEYVNNEMVVIETPVLTNFYLAEGDKNGLGSAQSVQRYNILMDRINLEPFDGMDDVRDALDSVSKDNFNEFESTEWSIVFNQTSKEIHYYHRENFSTQYVFNLE